MCARIRGHFSFSSYSDNDMAAFTKGTAVVLLRTMTRPSSISFRKDAVSLTQVANLSSTRRPLLPVSISHPESCLPHARHSVMGSRTPAHFFSTDSSYEEDHDSGPSQRPKQPPRWFQRPVIWVLAFVPAFTFGLGVWQIKRLRWKLDLIDELETKLKKDPLSLPKNIE